MTIRDAKQEDFEAIVAMYRAQGLDYSLNDLDSPLWLVRKVAVDDAGKVVGACWLRAALETYLWVYPESDAPFKMQIMDALQPPVLEAAWALGLDSVEARIPTDIERKFRKRLCRLGWKRNRDGWHPWSRSTHA